MINWINWTLDQNKEIKNLINKDIQKFDLYINNLNNSDILDYWNNLKKIYNKYFIWAIFVRQYNFHDGDFSRFVKSIKWGLKNSIYIRWISYGKNSKQLNLKLFYSLISYFLKFWYENIIQYKDVYETLRSEDITKIQLSDILNNEENITNEKIEEDYLDEILSEEDLFEFNRDDVDFVDKEWTFAVVDGEVVPACDFVCNFSDEIFTEYWDEVNKNKENDEENNLHFNH